MTMQQVCELRKSDSYRSGGSDVAYQDVRFSSAPLASFDTFDLSDDDFSVRDLRLNSSDKLSSVIQGRDAVLNETILENSSAEGTIECFVNDGVGEVQQCVSEVQKIGDCKPVDVSSELVVETLNSVTCETQKKSPKKYKFNLKSNSNKSPKKSKERRIGFGIFSNFTWNKNKQQSCVDNDSVKSDVNKSDCSRNGISEKDTKKNGVNNVVQNTVDHTEPIGAELRNNKLENGEDVRESSKLSEETLVPVSTNNAPSNVIEEYNTSSPKLKPHNSVESDSSSEEIGTNYSETIHGRTVQVHVYGQITQTNHINQSSVSVDDDVKVTADSFKPRTLDIQIPNWDSIPSESSQSLECVDPTKLHGSKKKAYLKKIERLQVQTASLVRPRSSVPLSITSLAEYTDKLVKSDVSRSADKIQILLPTVSDPVNNHPKSAGVKPSTDIFNEQFLFAHTKSALLYSSDSSIHSAPRRVLLSPGLATCNATSPNIVLTPTVCKSNNTADSTDNIFRFPADTTVNNTTIQSTSMTNWATFNAHPNSLTQDNPDSTDSTSDNPNTHINTTNIDQIGDLLQRKDGSNKPDIFIEQNDEMLTITFETYDDNHETVDQEIQYDNSHETHEAESADVTEPHTSSATSTPDIDVPHRSNTHDTRVIPDVAYFSSDDELD